MTSLLYISVLSIGDILYTIIRYLLQILEALASLWNQYIGLAILVFIASSVSYMVMSLVADYAKKQLRIFGDLRFNYISPIHREAFSMLYNGMDPNSILKQLRKMRFSYLEETTKNKNTQKKIAFATAVLKDDELMKKYIIVPEFNYKTFKQLRKEVGPTPIIEDQRLSYKELDNILINTNSENNKRVRDVIALVTSQECLDKTDYAKKCGAGKICVIIYKCLLGSIIRDDTSQTDFVVCLNALQKCFPKMKIVKLSEFSKQMSKTDKNDKEYIEIKEIIREYLPEIK